MGLHLLAFILAPSGSATMRFNWESLSAVLIYVQKCRGGQKLLVSWEVVRNWGQRKDSHVNCILKKDNSSGSPGSWTVSGLADTCSSLGRCCRELMGPFRSFPSHNAIRFTVLREPWLWYSSIFPAMKLGNAFNILRPRKSSCQQSPVTAALQSRCGGGNKTLCEVQGWHLEGTAELQRGRWGVGQGFCNTARCRKAQISAGKMPDLRTALF